MDIGQASGISLGEKYSLFNWKREAVSYLWEDLEELLERDRRWQEYYDLASLKQLIEESDQVITWTMHEGRKMVSMAVTQRVDYPNISTLLYLWMSALPGYLQDTVDFAAPRIESWARDYGMERIEILGRRGLIKFFPQYDLKSVLLVKDL